MNEIYNLKRLPQYHYVLQFLMNSYNRLFLILGSYQDEDYCALVLKAHNPSFEEALLRDFLNEEELTEDIINLWLKAIFCYYDGELNLPQDPVEFTAFIQEVGDEIGIDKILEAYIIYQMPIDDIILP